MAYDDRLRNSVPAELLEAPLRGVALVGKLGPAALRGWEKVHVPVVLADHPGGSWKLHAAGVDNAGATREAVRRLLALGHRRMAFVRRVHTFGVHDVEPDSRERQKVFLAALEEAGMSGAEAAVYSVFAQDTAAAPGIAALFTQTPRFTAVLAADAGCAGLVREAARARGLHVPRDLSLVTYEPLGPREPFFAGPRFDFREVGRRAARLAGAPRVPSQRVRVPGVWADGKTLALARET